MMIEAASYSAYLRVRRRIIATVLPIRGPVGPTVPSRSEYSEAFLRDGQSLWDWARKRSLCRWT